MFQKFFTKTLESKFIKNLIYSTALPIYKSVRDGDYILKDSYYVYRDSIIKCTTSGYINTSDELAEYIVVKDYIFGKYYPQFTEKFISEFSYYDSETHEHLGKYLRCIRDLYDVDLMPFYNCYSSKVADNFYVKVSRIAATEGSSDLIPTYELVNAANSDYKVLQIPINFNQTYTIALDTDCETILMPAIIHRGQFVTVFTEDKQKLDLTNLLQQKAIVKNSMSFKHPLVYQLDLKPQSTIAKTYAKYLEANERNLYLLIQLPSTEDTSVVVLEGDYSKYEYCQKYFNGEDLDSLTQRQKDFVYLSALSLLKLNDKISYAFSDRLLEYLTLGVITPLDEIDDNILRVQEAQNLLGLLDMTEGVWSDKIRNYYFKRIMENKKIEHYDLTGYIDKDIEKYLVK